MTPDMSLAADQWHNIYALYGISVGTPLLIYNKSISTVMLWDGAAPLSNESWDGVPAGDYPVVVESGAAGCWAKSHGRLILSVQVYSGD